MLLPGQLTDTDCHSFTQVCWSTDAAVNDDDDDDDIGV